MSVEVNYTVSGGREKPPIVFIHGVGDSACVWEPITQGLQANRTFIRYDLRGHGASPCPRGPYSIDDFVCDHRDLMSRLGFPQTDLVGFSLGGLIAQAVAIWYPELVSRLIVIGSVAGRTADEKKRVNDRLRMIEDVGPVEVARESVRRWFTPEYLAAHPEAYETTVSRMKKLDPESYLASYRVLAETDFVSELATIQSPTLAITGEGDIGSPPRMSRTIAHLVPQGRVKIIPSAQHAVIREQPDTIIREVHNFVY